MTKTITLDIADSLDSLAYGHLTGGYFDKALTLYRFLHQQDPEESKWSLAMIFCLLNRGKFDEIASLLQHLEEHPPPLFFAKAHKRLQHHYHSLTS